MPSNFKNPEEVVRKDAEINLKITVMYDGLKYIVEEHYSPSMAKHHEDNRPARKTPGTHKVTLMCRIKMGDVKKQILQDN